MVVGLVASDGPVFIPEDDKVNTEVYIRILIKYVLPWIKEHTA